MMNRETLVKTMGERELRMSEILSHGFSLLSGRFGRYLLLSVLVYLPINALLQYFALTADYSLLDTLSLETMDLETLAAIDMTPLMNSALHNLIAQLGAEFIGMIAILVTAVIVKNQLFDPRNHSFGTSFYRGVRMWPRAALSMVLVLIQMVIALMASSIFIMIPLLGLISIAMLVFLMVRFTMYECLCGCAAGLRGRLGFDNLRYIRFLTQRRFFRVWGAFAILTLISNGVMLLVEGFSMNLLLFSENLYVQAGISIALSTFLSILNIYSFICGTLIFFNMEEIKRTELRRITAASPSEMDRTMAQQTLEAMDAVWDEEEEEEKEEDPRE